MRRWLLVLALASCDGSDGTPPGSPDGSPASDAPTGADAPPSSSSGYTLTDLGVLPGLGHTSSRAFGINDAAHVVGESCEPGATRCHAFLWRNGAMEDLGTLAGGNFATARRVNAGDVVVGQANQNGGILGFRWANGTMERLVGPCLTPTGCPNPVSLGGDAFAVNEAGDVGGIAGYWMPGVVQQATIWHNGAPTAITQSGTPGQKITGFNDAGGACGDVDVVPGTVRAALWNGTMWTDLGTLSGDQRSQANDMNASNQVVGVSIPSGRAFVWEGGAMHDLGALPLRSACEARAINDRGQIVGRCASTDSEAFLWENGELKTLRLLLPPADRSVWSLVMAEDIDETGRIAAWGAHSGDPGYHAVLLTPAP